ncbi:hypothetical protein QQF64_034112 [Cirrhinus molitorella]|uniref:Tf2-1-like SH3-like domain-containing protein n=1 Tax=Cirrhinus molitorella TaxID=172907 RepID=A0ABR3MVU0_9TELE
MNQVFLTLSAWSSIREAHDHARSILAGSHAKRKKYYDRRRRPVSYAVDELVRVKTHPRSDALANFTAKLAPVYMGPYRVTKKLSELNYRLTDVSTEMDAGVFHVANLLPFRTWDSTVVPETVPTEGPSPEASADDRDDGPEEVRNGAATMILTDLQFENERNCPVSTSVRDQSKSEDGVNSLPDMQAEFVTQNNDLNVGGNDSNRHHYDLRPRRAPRITSDWSTNRFPPQPQCTACIQFPWELNTLHPLATLPQESSENGAATANAFGNAARAERTHANSGITTQISSTTTMHSMYSVPMGAKHAPPTRYITSGIKREWSRHSKCVW